MGDEAFRRRRAPPLSCRRPMGTVPIRVDPVMVDLTGDSESEASSSPGGVDGEGSAPSFQGASSAPNIPLVPNPPPVVHQMSAIRIVRNIITIPPIDHPTLNLLREHLPAACSVMVDRRNVYNSGPIEAIIVALPVRHLCSLSPQLTPEAASQPVPVQADVNPVPSSPVLHQMGSRVRSQVKRALSSRGPRFPLCHLSPSPIQTFSRPSASLCSDPRGSSCFPRLGLLPVAALAHRAFSPLREDQGDLFPDPPRATLSLPLPAFAPGGLPVRGGEPGALEAFVSPVLFPGQVGSSGGMMGSGQSGDIVGSGENLGKMGDCSVRAPREVLSGLGLGRVGRISPEIFRRNQVEMGEIGGPSQGVHPVNVRKGRRKGRKRNIRRRKAGKQKKMDLRRMWKRS